MYMFIRFSRSFLLELVYFLSVDEREVQRVILITHNLNVQVKLCLEIALWSFKAC